MSATTETTLKTCASDTFSHNPPTDPTVWRNDGPGLPLTTANLQLHFTSTTSAGGQYTVKFQVALLEHSDFIKLSKKGRKQKKDGA